MSKKVKSNKNFASETPEVYNMDDIGYMSDEAIHDRSNRLENERGRLMSAGKDTYLWDIEVAYLQREQQLRQTRSERHAEFIQRFGKSNPENLDFDKIATTSVETTEELN